MSLTIHLFEGVDNKKLFHRFDADPNRTTIADILRIVRQNPSVILQNSNILVDTTLCNCASGFRGSLITNVYEDPRVFSWTLAELERAHRIEYEADGQRLDIFVSGCRDENEATRFIQQDLQREVKRLKKVRARADAASRWDLFEDDCCFSVQSRYSAQDRLLLDAIKNRTANGYYPYDRQRAVEVSLKQAAIEGSIDTMRALVEEMGAHINAPCDALGMTPLHIAASEGHVEAVSALITNMGANVDAADSNLKRPIHYAHTVEVARTLAFHGADVHRGDNAGMTPLHCASTRGYVDVMRVLVHELGADANVRNDKLRTPLHHAAVEGRIDAMSELVLQMGADVNGVDFRGWTALHHASYQRRKEAVIVLARKLGADQTLTDIENTSARNWWPPRVPWPLSP